MERYFGEHTPKLGFGLMRLPKRADGTIDMEQTKQMVDAFMEAGMTYFDTAYVYDNGASELAARAALVDRYPRERFTLATKLNAWMGKQDAQSARQQFYTSLERTHAGYIDYYLLHAIKEENRALYDDLHIWEFMKELKAQGLIRHWGFSFHGSPRLLDELLTQHPDVEFVQLQLNYADWEHPGIASRENYEVARKHGKSIVVMEPVKGGVLADPPKPVQEILRQVDPNASFASWAIRYAASLDSIITVLSGMSDRAQMADNLSFMRSFVPLNDAQQETIRQAQNALSQIRSIACTACHYCTEGCPKHIPIPEIFAARNKQLIWGQIEAGARSYAQAIEGKGRAMECIACGQCERACPQHLPIIDWLKDCAAVLDEQEG